MMSYVARLPDILTVVNLEELPEKKYQPAFKGNVDFATVLKSSLECS